MLEVGSPRKSGFLFNLDLLALWIIFCHFFTYSESPLNSLLYKVLKCKNYSMGIGVMTVSKKLLANPRICGTGFTRRGTPPPTPNNQANPSIILYNINKLNSVENSSDLFSFYSAQTNSVHGLACSVQLRLVTLWFS